MVLPFEPSLAISFLSSFSKHFICAFVTGPSKVPGWSSVWDTSSYAPHCSVRLVSFPQFPRKLLESTCKENASSSSSSWTSDFTRWRRCWLCTSSAAGKDWNLVKLCGTAWENKYAKLCFSLLKKKNVYLFAIKLKPKQQEGKRSSFWGFDLCSLNNFQINIAFF